MSTFEPFLAYEASAGSGKTFNLVVRYLSLLFMGEDPSAITALTFTNKAANEMMERIGETLLHLESRGELEEICKVTDKSRDEILAQRPKVLSRFLRSNLNISTIDRFLGTILRKFSLHAGIMPTFSAANEHHQIRFMERFLNELEVAGKMEMLVRLSLLGSKRLDDIFMLLSSLYAKHKEFAHLAFPKPEPISEIYAEALHHAKALRDLVHSKGLSATANNAVEVDDYETLLKKTWLYKDSMDYWVFKKGYVPQMDEHLRAIQECVRREMNHKEAEFFYALFDILGIYIKSRHAMIKAYNELTFDDITLMVHTLLHGQIESEFLYFRLDSTIKHLLLDEFQDTSVIQFEILRPLIEEIASGIGVKSSGSFFFVGDVKQSIYRFRGGFSALFYQVADHFDVQVKPLEVNYRSRSQIVEFVNQTFSSKIKRYIPQGSPAHKKGGYVEVTLSDEILESLEKKVNDLKVHGVNETEIVILTVTNSDGKKIEEFLQEKGYDVVTETTSLLIEQHSVKALIEYLKYCYFGADIYRHNCAVLLGVDIQSIVKENISDLLSSSIAFVRAWQIGDKSALMFIEQLGNFFDLEEVVFEYERLETNAPQSDLKGIRIMTVHKSKGLEFEHVIVCDRLGRGGNHSTSIVYEYEGTSLKRLFYRIKERDTLDADYRDALEKEKEFEAEDQLNALYVALTRAVQSLRLLVKSKDSWFKPLDLEPGAWGEEEYEHKPIKEEFLLRQPPNEKVYYGRQEENLVPDNKEPVDYMAAQFGLALHYTLEMIEGFQMDRLEEAMDAMMNRYGGILGIDGIESVRKRLIQLLDDQQFVNLTRGECFREQAFVIQGEKRVIDLLIKHDDRNWSLIDYKTGSEILQSHRDQVRGYVYAVHRLTGANVEGYLCYLHEDVIEWVKV